MQLSLALSQEPTVRLLPVVPVLPILMGAVLWLGTRLSMKVELRAERTTDPDDLWDNGLRHDRSVTLAQTWDRSVEVLSRWGNRVRRRLAPGVRE